MTTAKAKLWPLIASLLSFRASSGARTVYTHHPINRKTRDEGREGGIGASTSTDRKRGLFFRQAWNVKSGKKGG